MIRIIISLSFERKKFPTGSVVDSSHSNNGVTSTFVKGSKVTKEVFIFRFEDLFKVIVHELIHFFGPDFSVIQLGELVPEATCVAQDFNFSDSTGTIDLNE
eukprot:gene9304-16438_t